MLEIDLRTRLKALVDTRLKALVGTWRGQVTKSDRAFGYRLLAAASIKECADQLAALLAESEPELVHPCGYPHRLPPEDCPDCEAKAKLPLGHEFDALYHTARGAERERCARCGHTREAHEPKEA